jgi:hypothetical protein
MGHVPTALQDDSDERLTLSAVGGGAVVAPRAPAAGAPEDEEAAQREYLGGDDFEGLLTRSSDALGAVELWVGISRLGDPRPIPPVMARTSAAAAGMPWELRVVVWTIHQTEFNVRCPIFSTVDLLRPGAATAGDATRTAGDGVVPPGGPFDLAWLFGGGRAARRRDAVVDPSNPLAAVDALIADAYRTPGHPGRRGTGPTKRNLEIHWRVKFRVPVELAPICSMTLSAPGAQLLAYAVSNHYWYQMYLDELPMWAMVGEVVADEDVIREIESQTDRPHGLGDTTFLYLHKNITVAYNGDRVIEVNLASDEAAPIAADKTYELTYSVHWVPTDKEFSTRFNRYLDNSFFEHQIHWFSLFCF